VILSINLNNQSRRVHLQETFPNHSLDRSFEQQTTVSRLHESIPPVIILSRR
jgi:hypothetical protein